MMNTERKICTTVSSGKSIEQGKGQGKERWAEEKGAENDSEKNT